MPTPAHSRIFWSSLALSSALVPGPQGTSTGKRPHTPQVSVTLCLKQLVIHMEQAVGAPICHGMSSHKTWLQRQCAAVFWPMAIAPRGASRKEVEQWPPGGIFALSSNCCTLLLLTVQTLLADYRCTYLSCRCPDWLALPVVAPAARPQLHPPGTSLNWTSWDCRQHTHSSTKRSMRKSP